MKKDGKIICTWQIEIITPVHVGAAQEKHWQVNLDYIIKNNTVYFLDEKKIIERYGIDKYSNALAQGKIESLKGLFNNLEKYSYKTPNITGWTKEIKQQIKNSLSDKPIIPGSSLKGAIRSVLFAYLLKKNPRVKKERDIFGDISKDFMRYLEVFDTEFEKTEIFNTKIYNLKEKYRNSNQFISVWKNGFKYNDDKFKPNSFATGYECISPRKKAKVKIVFNQKAFDKAAKMGKVKVPNGLREIFNDDFEKNILKIIKAHNDNYLKKELEFFDKYKQAQYGKEVFEDIKYYADEFLEEGKTGLRLAAGSGFHSITGDWKLETHYINGVSYRRGMYKEKKSAKSRKLAFEKINGKFKFYPMGFIHLLSTAETKNIEKQEEKTLERLKNVKENDKIINVETKEEKVDKAPTLTLKNKFRKGRAIWIDGEVIGQNGRMMLFKPFVEGFENTVSEVSYASGMPIGTIIQIQAMLVAKGKKLQIQGSPKVK